MEMNRITWWIVLLVGIVSAAPIKEHSILPPHATFDLEGKRMVENWVGQGTSNTVVNEHFIRLTPDRQVWH